MTALQVIRMGYNGCFHPARCAGKTADTVNRSFAFVLTFSTGIESNSVRQIGGTEN